VTEDERSFHKDYEGGTLVTNDDKASRFEFLTAKFGSPLPLAGKDLEFVVAEPANACHDLSNADQARGKIVVIKRGGCPFTDKAYSVERAGGIVAVMVNNHRTILRMDSLKRYESYNISISMVMVTNNAGDHLMSMSGTGNTIHFEDGNVTSEEWTGLKNSISAEQWPMDPQECHDVFMKLREDHKNSPERLAVLESAYLETGPEAEEELKKLNKNSNFRN